MNLKNIFNLIFVAAPVVLFCAFVGYFALDMPQGDDFELTLNFLHKYLNNKDIDVKFELLFEQFVEHRLFYTRLVVLLQYFFTGQVSFYGIIVIGNLSLIGILWIVWQQLKALRLPMLYLLPVVLLIFQPCYSYDGVLWPAATLAYNSVVFFALLTVHWLSNARRLSFWLAVLSATLCTFTFGNGILVWVAGAVILGLQKRWKPTAIWTGCLCLIMSAYFYDYTFIQTRNNPLQNLVQHPQYVFLNFLIFSGAALNWSEAWPKNLTPSDSWSIVVGLLVVLGFVKLVVEVLKKWPLKPSKMTYFLVGSLIFLLGTGFVLSASRLQKDEIWMHINRYRVHSVAALVLTYLYFVPMLATRFTAFLTTLGVVFLFFCLSYFHFYSVFDFNKRGFLAGQFNWTTTGEWFVYRDTPYWEGASKIVMQNARQSHLYQLDHTPFSVVQPSATTTKLNVKHQAAEKILDISGESPQLRFWQNPVDYYFVFKNLSTHKTYLHAAQYDARSVRLVALGNPYYYPTFHTYLHYRHFPAGQYQVGYATVSPDSRLQYYWQDFYFSTEPVLALRK